MSTLGDRPAFPRPWSDESRDQEGMSLRQWLAGQALSSISPGYSSPEHVAMMVVRIADATLKELAKEGR